MKKVLILGGGMTPNKRMRQDSLSFYPHQVHNKLESAMTEITTIDNNPECFPTYLHDLNWTPWEINIPIPTHEYDEVHAYEVLEHLGHQGNVAEFFDTFREIWYALKLDTGLLFASVPSYKSLWAWGDPSHTRIINAGTLMFLCRNQYDRQLGRTSMSDYRHLLVGDWEIVNAKDDGERFRFVMRAK